MNVSAIGNGSGGTVGVKFPNWNVEGGWNSAITRFIPGVQAGDYTYTATFAGDSLTGGGNRIRADLWWTDDPTDPWSNTGLIETTGWVNLDASDNGVWQTHVVNFTILASDPSVGNYFAPYIRVENYNGNILLGEATLVQSVPEPGSMLMLGTGLFGLLGFRKRFKRF